MMRTCERCHSNKNLQGWYAVEKVEICKQCAVELRNKDAVAKRYGWTDYDNFITNEDGCQNWSFRAVKDIIKLEKENAELRANWAELKKMLELTIDNSLRISRAKLRGK